MENSLYEISEDIQNIFDIVEENDGEITEEQDNLLEIKQEEFENKINSYYKAIKIWKNNAENCKAERKRINDVQNKYKNRVERLKKSMLDAVLMFGKEGKNNKFIELPTVRLSTKATKFIEENHIRITDLITYFREYLTELITNGVLDVEGEIDIEGFLNAINANYKADLGEGEEYIPFTIEDLKCIQVSVNNTKSLYNILVNGKNLYPLIAYDDINTNINNITSNEDYKKYLDNITVAKEVINQSLLIK